MDGGFLADLLGGEPLDAGDPAGGVEAVFHHRFGRVEDVDKGHEGLPVGAGGAGEGGDVFDAFGAGAFGHLGDGAAGFFDAVSAACGEAGVELEEEVGELLMGVGVHEHGFEGDGDVLGDHVLGDGVGEGVGAFGVELGGELLGEGGFQHFLRDDAAFGAALFLPADVGDAVADAVCPVGGA